MEKESCEMLSDRLNTVEVIRLVGGQEKNQKCQKSLHNCEDFLLFFVWFESELIIFGFGWKSSNLMQCFAIF